MPSNTVKSLADKAGISYQKAEEYWDKAKGIAKERMPDEPSEEDERSDDYWAYVMGVFKNMLGLNEGAIEIGSVETAKHPFKPSSLRKEDRVIVDADGRYGLSDNNYIGTVSDRKSDSVGISLDADGSQYSLNIKNPADLPYLVGKAKNSYHQTKPIPYKNLGKYLANSQPGGPDLRKDPFRSTYLNRLFRKYGVGGCLRKGQREYILTDVSPSEEPDGPGYTLSLIERRDRNPDHRTEEVDERTLRKRRKQMTSVATESELKMARKQVSRLTKATS